MGEYTLYTGDCLEKIKEMGNESVHLVCTSPPYFNAKTYNNEVENMGNNISYQHYLDRIEELLIEIYRIIKPGGKIIWNTSPVLDNGKRYTIPFDTNTIFTQMGFEFLEDIVWLKPSGAAKLRCGGWVQNGQKPHTWHANVVTEYVMVYKKPGNTSMNGVFNSVKQYYTKLPPDLYTNVWYINPESNKQYHDAPFPEELVKRCILLYTFEGDVVFDPFLGSGTVLKVAKSLNRNGVGIELSPKYMEYAKANIGIEQSSLFEQHKYIIK